MYWAQKQYTNTMQHIYNFCNINKQTLAAKQNVSGSGIFLGSQCPRDDMTANTHVYVNYIQVCIMLSDHLFTFTSLANAFIQSILQTRKKAIYLRCIPL